MSQNNKSIKLFQNKEIRAAWNNEEDDWYFSIVDIVETLTESADYQTARKYWNKLKQRLKDEGNELVTNCHQLKMPAADGKMRLTDVANTKQVLRIIQSIPSPKAEPFKTWLAQVGADRLDEIADPEKAIDRAVESYRQKGYSESWINQRIKSIDIRKGLTDEWNRSGVKQGIEYAMLTDEITRSWSGMSTREYKEYKGLTKESLRDNMTNLELVLNMLAEVSTTEISKANNPTTFNESAVIARQGGHVASKARTDLEQKIGKSVVSPLNASDVLRKIENNNETSKTKTLE